MRARFKAGTGVPKSPWIILPSTASFTADTIQYARRGDDLYVELAGSTSGALASGTALSVALPDALMPTRQVIRQVQGAGTLRGVYLNTDGIVRVDFGATGVVGFFGGFSFPIG